MRSRLLLTLGLAASTTAVWAQGQTPPVNLQAPQDPRYAEVIATCRTPPPGPGAAGGAGGGPPAGQGRGATPGRADGPAAYTVTAIAGVIAPGQRWRLVWQTTGNNADGIIASDDGGLLLAQNDNGVVVRLDREHRASVAHRDTNTGGSLARSASGALFVVSRGIGTAVLQLEPARRVLANRYRDDPLECLGGVINDLAADNRGGVYFTMGGVYYADSKGIVTSYGTNLRTNGIVLSPDERTLYVTNGATVVAFDARNDGSLGNQRDFARLPSGSGDGMSVDATGRLYVTTGAGAAGTPGVHVIAPDGRLLGTIPGPRNFITVAFSGPGKGTLYAVANDRRVVEVYAIDTLTTGYAGRAK